MFQKTCWHALIYCWFFRPTSRGSTSGVSRTLPKGPGPLDPSGRKLANFTVGSKTSPTKGLGYNSGPIRATHDYTTSYGATYGGAGSTSTLGRQGLTSSAGSRPRRSSSLANIRDGVDNMKITDIDYNDSRPGSRDKDDLMNSRNSRRKSRADESYVPSTLTPRTGRKESDSSEEIVRNDVLNRRTSGTEKRSIYDNVEDSMNGSRSYNGTEKSWRSRPESPLGGSQKNSRHNSPSVVSMIRLNPSFNIFKWKRKVTILLIKMHRSWM